MPPSRRKSANPVSRSSQSTLTFNSHAKKITKPSSVLPSKSEQAEKSKLSKLVEIPAVSTPSPAPEEIRPAIDESATIDSTSELEIKVEKERKTEIEEEAKRISGAQIKRYWKAKEDGRKAPRVHQQGLTLYDKILREFDLSSQYGPCIGINRSKRWKRAHALGLKPPIEALAVLLREESTKDSMSVQRAYIDELMISKFGDE